MIKNQESIQKRILIVLPLLLLRKMKTSFFIFLWFYFGAFSVLSRLKINWEIELLEILKSLNAEKVVFNCFYCMQTVYATASFYA